MPVADMDLSKAFQLIGSIVQNHEARLKALEDRDAARHETVKELRRRLQPKWTGARLAMEAGINRNSYSRIESGRTLSPTSAIVERIARALRCSSSDVFNAISETRKRKGSK